MNKNRLEAFSDAVIAIIMTIMVLEMKVPHEPNFSALRTILPVFLSYILSFIFLGIYWINHHHLFQVAERVNGRVLWANLHLLFWLSLIPFVAGWMGESGFACWPVALYGVVMLAAALSYSLLSLSLISHHGEDSAIALALGRDHKGMVSIILHATAIGIAFWRPIISCLLYFLAALIWIIPDSRIEKTVQQSSS
jgi:uncharacterized membrane protein